MKPLDFPGVRTVMLDGKPWLVRIDVSDHLGINRGSVPADWTESDVRLVGGSVVPVKPGQTRSIGDGHGRKFLVITPAAAYRLAMRSDKPAAVAFQRWLADEVLPSIEQHGIYVAGQEAVRDDPEAFTALVLEKARGLIADEVQARLSARTQLDTEIAVLSAIRFGA